MSVAVSRNLVVQKWGTPAQTWGSLNEPREREENGIAFNEKWIYEHPRGERGVRRRVIYWRRYDCAGSLIERHDGEWVRENLGAILGREASDRRHHPRRDDSTSAQGSG